ncbi:Major facilitator superfamily domain general substrate transporter [Macrophomina phaseolina MS6]|uniref:Major facilitator superfamily domain general substrate transporter n=1 Tax=Macrophomina phaseolina (strain MS6) TaxID=1126212 RepID=K2RHQ4_MACPH|nr:Major facilitator superfamily domain general substrate transporter [Macrophomina phaseolina MS6]
MARRRLAADGNEAPKVQLARSVVAAVFKSWRWYAFVLLYIVFNQAMITNGQPFSLYLKAHADRYSPSEINNIPTGQSAVSIVAALGFCYWADVTRNRWRPSLAICVCMAFGSVCMAVWHTPVGLKLFAFYVAGLGGALNPLFMSWASEVVSLSLLLGAVHFADCHLRDHALGRGAHRGRCQHERFWPSASCWLEHRDIPDSAGPAIQGESCMAPWRALADVAPVRLVLGHGEQHCPDPSGRRHCRSSHPAEAE